MSIGSLLPSSGWRQSAVSLEKNRKHEAVRSITIPPPSPILLQKQEETSKQCIDQHYYAIANLECFTNMNVKHTVKVKHRESKTHNDARTSKNDIRLTFVKLLSVDMLLLHALKLLSVDMT